jgi:hypothetical protein
MRPLIGPGVHRSSQKFVGVYKKEREAEDVEVTMDDKTQDS